MGLSGSERHHASVAQRCKDR
jgi:hypothetical protein